MSGLLETRVSKPVLLERHISYYPTVRGSGILRNLIVSTNFSKIDYFFIIGKISSRAGFDPWAVI